jgi:RNA polymerase sigma-70 factor (ECF subfamily)
MSFLREVHLDDNFGPFVACRDNFGFIANLLRAQTLLPRLVEAQASLESAVLIKERALSRVRKELISLGVAAAHQDTYSVARHATALTSLDIPESQLLRLLTDFHDAGLSEPDEALLAFSLKLSRSAPSVNWGDIEGLRRHGFNDEAILEGVLVTALSSFLRTLSAGLGPEPDFKLPKLPSTQITPPEGTALQSLVTHNHHASGKKAPYLSAPYRSPKTFAPFVFFQKSHGFVPNFFRAQTLRPDVLEAEAEAVARILLPEDVLSRVQKECILLAVSAANLNSYCVAVHCNMLRGLGLSPEEGDQVAMDHHQSCISQADKALLDFALKLGARPSEFCREDVERLRTAGFTEEQILECVAVTALNNFANTVQMGLGILPDFEPPLAFAPKKMHLFTPGARPMAEGSGLSPSAGAIEDPDGPRVSEAQAGSLEAFEVLIRRHSGRVYRTLMAILDDSDEAKDAMQDAFLKAFKHISDFQGRSKFSTWLVSIARNTAVQRLRDRKKIESLDENVSGEEEEFRPRQVRAWQDNPETMYSHTEIRQLVEKGIMQLPAKLRVVVMLRDIEQLSTEEVAHQLGLSVPALKARLFRGRLMLREVLSPHFTTSATKVAL